MSESQTETDLFDKILPLLGFAFHRRSFQLVGFPDYILYDGEEAKTQSGQLPDEQRYQLGIGLLEAKMFDLPLDRKSRRETPGLPYYRQIRNYLTDRPGSPINWGILSNGNEWRLYHSKDDVTSYFSMRLSRVLADLDSLRLFLALFGRSAFAKGDDGFSRLDSLWNKSLARRQDLEERLRVRVFKLAEIVANGFYTPKVNNKIREDQIEEVFTYSLILLYRLLFVLYAESRELLPVQKWGSGARKRYRELYSLRQYQEILPNSSYRSEDDVHTTMWPILVELSKTIDGENEARSESLGIPRYNGGLFDPKKYYRISTIDTSKGAWFLGNYTVQQLLKGLIYAPLPSSDDDTISVDFKETIDYASLSVLQLGSIYEGLLEYKPKLANGRIKFVEVRQQARARSDRKVSGSYYTPEWVVDYIIEETLAPLIQKVRDSQPVSKGLPNSFAEGVLKLRLLDPSMGSGHFLVRATEYLGDLIADHPTSAPANPDKPDDLKANKAYWRRRVVESCIYGVDLNDLAVELAKLALWLTCITSSNPLNFLDHHLRHGNSLAGSTTDLFGFVPERLRRKDGALFEATGVQTALNDAIEALSRIHEMPSDNYPQVKEKEAIFRREVLQRLSPFENIAHLRTAADFGYDIDQLKYTELCEKLLGGDKLPDDAGDIRHRNRFFHFELAFPEVFFHPGEPRGFDAVIGNPPYVRQESLGAVKEFLDVRFTTSSATTDLYIAFIEQAFNLMREGGRFGYIVSNKWMRAAYGEKLREFLLAKRLEKLVDFGEAKVFDEPAVMPMIVIASKQPPEGEPRFAAIPELPAKSNDVQAKQIRAIFEDSAFPLSAGALSPTGFTLVQRGLVDVFEKMREAGKPLGEYVGNQIYYGIKTGLNEAFVITAEQRQRLIDKDPKSSEIIVPFVKGDDVRKWRVNYRDRYLIMTKIGVDIEEYPLIFDHLKDYQPQLEKRQDQGKHWWELRACDYYDEFLKPKIIWPDIAMESRFAYDIHGLYSIQTCYIMPTNDLFLTGLLNSKAVWQYLLRHSAVLGDPDMKGRIRQIRQYMVSVPTSGNGNKLAITGLTDHALRIKDSILISPGLAERRRLEAQLAEVERAIDRAVYELYGLTEKEIAIVEGRS
ncbi:MAG: hypothetical protein FJY67_00780 [Calditrichaeota bacterium]|nr:hypothetical protein [Calditrichota bacterium]